MRTSLQATVKTNYDSALDGWRHALAKLDELKAATGGRWGVLKVQIETAYHAIEAALGIGRPAAVPDKPIRDPRASTRITEPMAAVAVPESERET